MEQQEDYNAKLKEYLLNKLKEQNSPGYGQEVQDVSSAANSNNADNAFASSLMKSSAQMGSIGGKVADTSAVGDMADQLRGVNAGRVNQAGQELETRDNQYKMNADVYKYLADKQQKDATGAATAQFREKELGMKEKQIQAANSAKMAEKAENQRRFDDRLTFDKTKFAHEKEAGAAKILRDKEIADAKIAEKTVSPKSEVELNSRVTNIQSNIDKLKGIIGKTGTFEMFGPESDTMDQVIQDIAVDYAKMVDPESVARESEVESAKKMLNVKGLGTRNSTALTSLDEFRDQLETRVNSRRSAQGLQPIDKTPRQGGDGSAIAGQDKNDPQIAEYAKQHGLEYGAAKNVLVGRGYQPNEQ